MTKYEGHENKFLGGIRSTYDAWGDLAAEWNALQGKLNERDAEIARLREALGKAARHERARDLQIAEAYVRAVLAAAWNDGIAAAKDETKGEG